jgi:hypothetical protein
MICGYATFMLYFIWGIFHILDVSVGTCVPILRSPLCRRFYFCFLDGTCLLTGCVDLGITVNTMLTTVLSVRSTKYVIKGKIAPEEYLHAFLKLSIMWGWVVASRPGHFTPARDSPVAMRLCGPQNRSRYHGEETYGSKPRIEHRIPGRLALVVITICQTCRIKQLIEAKPIKYSKSELIYWDSSGDSYSPYDCNFVYSPFFRFFFSHDVLENGSVPVIPFDDGGSLLGWAR